MHEESRCNSKNSERARSAYVATHSSRLIVHFLWTGWIGISMSVREQASAR
jgi:hypothetical protein